MTFYSVGQNIDQLFHLVFWSHEHTFHSTCQRFLVAVDSLGILLFQGPLFLYFSGALASSFFLSPSSTFLTRA